MSELKMKISKAVSGSMMALGKRESDAQYGHFSQLLEQAKSILSERNVSVAWPDEVGGSHFLIDTPVGQIYAKRLAFLDDEQIGAAVVFYCVEENGEKAHDLCVLRLTSYGTWLLSGDVPVLDGYRQHIPASAVSAVTAAIAAKLEFDHKRVMAA